MVYFVLIKKKGHSKWLGAIPSKPGSNIASIRKECLFLNKKGLSTKIITKLRGKKMGKTKKQKAFQKAWRTRRKRYGKDGLSPKGLRKIKRVSKKR